MEQSSDRTVAIADLHLAIQSLQTIESGNTPGSKEAHAKELDALTNALLFTDKEMRAALAVHALGYLEIALHDGISNTSLEKIRYRVTVLKKIEPALYAPIIKLVEQCLDTYTMVCALIAVQDADKIEKNYENHHPDYPELPFQAITEITLGRGKKGYFSSGTVEIYEALLAEVERDRTRTPESV